MIVAIDFDSVIYPTFECALQIYNRANNDNLTLDQFTDYDYHNIVSSEIANKIDRLFDTKETFEIGKPYPGAVDALKALNNGNKLYVVTASSSRNLRWKEDIIKRYFSFIPTDNIVRLCDKSLFKCDALIDDCLDNLKNCFADRVTITRPWNVNDRADLVYGIHRAKSWEEIPKIIHEIEEGYR